MNDVIEFCLKYGLQTSHFFGLQIWDGHMDLDCETIPNGFSPKVNGDLDLCGLICLPENFVPNIYGDLTLGPIDKFPLTTDLSSVSGDLYVEDRQIVTRRIDEQVCVIWTRDGNYNNNFVKGDKKWKQLKLEKDI